MLPLLDSVVDTASWPCSSPVAFWALEDTIEDIGMFLDYDVDARTAEYEIQVNDLPRGRVLREFTGLRNIEVDLSKLPAKVTAVSLVIGCDTVDRVNVPDGSKKVVLPMFTDRYVLPLFVVGHDILRVRLHISGRVKGMPRHAINAVGLYFKVKRQDQRFAVATGPTTLTWDGQKLNVMRARAKAQSVLSGDSAKWPVSDDDSSTTVSDECDEVCDDDADDGADDGADGIGPEALWARLSRRE